MFFKAHGEIQYNIFGTEHEMTDITKSSITIDLKNTSIHTINVGNRTPEQIAHDEYGDASYYWTILLINNIVNPFLDWHMTDDQLYDFCIRKYGTEDAMLKTKYFRRTDTDEIVTGDAHDRLMRMHEAGELLPENIIFVRFYDHEKLINDKKSVIRIIPKQLISRFIEDFKSELKDNS